VGNEARVDGLGLEELDDVAPAEAVAHGADVLDAVLLLQALDRGLEDGHDALRGVRPHPGHDVEGGHAFNKHSLGDGGAFEDVWDDGDVSCAGEVVRETGAEC
jgi:hypothetical protein